MTISLWLDERTAPEVAKALTIEADIAIIGGGIVGAAAAYFASIDRGIKKIVILEAGQTACGLSGRNGGIQ